MKISTKTGDKGETSLFGGRRVPKSDSLIEIVGELDEFQSFIGWAMCECDDEILRRIQDDIYRLMSYFGFEMKWPGNIVAVGAEDVGFLESEIEAREGEMSEFVRPGGSEAAARLHVCRTVCRRVERRVVEVGCEAEVLKYINRLSDLLFLIAIDRV
ncbi:cob(I)yrinic acid a,c-diamide adenosyltransferase [Candidatus Gracilibacteria bacterium]|nr:cob(I)yrinic acid a,c-diamide adenosyltransferase [Candidatus Gracilibacteria bacterium]